jgi:hypothetical protein
VKLTTAGAVVEDAVHVNDATGEGAGTDLVHPFISKNPNNRKDNFSVFIWLYVIY